MPETECREGFPIFRDLVGIATDDGTLLPSSPVSARFPMYRLAGAVDVSRRLAIPLDPSRRGVGAGIDDDAGAGGHSRIPSRSAGSWYAAPTRKSRSAKPRHSGSTALRRLRTRGAFSPSCVPSNHRMRKPSSPVPVSSFGS